MEESMDVPRLGGSDIAVRSALVWAIDNNFAMGCLCRALKFNWRAETATLDVMCDVIKTYVGANDKKGNLVPGFLLRWPHWFADQLADEAEDLP